VINLTLGRNPGHLSTKQWAGRNQNGGELPKSIRQKSTTIPVRKSADLRKERIANMRVAIAVLFSAMAVLAVPAGHSFAKTSDVPKTSDELSSSPCHAYEQSPDGSWKQLPCQEDGLKAQPASKISTRDVGKGTDLGKSTEPGKATR
jgi:hypothetical protein